MDRRQHPRFAIALLAFYWGAEQWITGMTVNLSQGGCALRSEVVALERTYTAMQLWPPGYETALDIDLAVVRWTRHHTFGLEFLRLRPRDQERLLAFVRSQEMEARKDS